MFNLAQSFLKSSIVICYNINKRTYLLMYKVMYKVSSGQSSSYDGPELKPVYRQVVAVARLVHNPPPANNSRNSDIR